MEAAPHTAAAKNGLPGGNKLEKTAELEPGVQIFERFVLVSVLGEGRCSTVWLADDPRFRREVALKIFHSASNDNADAERLIWREVLRRLRVLHHPNVAMAMEFFNQGSWIALSNQHVAGKNLAALTFLSGKKLSSNECTSILKSIGLAMVAAHEKSRVIHGNLNAYNILLTDGERQAKITDFGFHPPIAANWGSADLNLPWKIACLSPERLAGGAPSIADDIHAFAVVAFQLFTGMNPPRSELGVLETAATTTLLGSAPDIWRNTLLANLSQEVADRSESMKALLQQLHLAEAPGLVDPEKMSSPSGGGSRRRKRSVKPKRASKHPSGRRKLTRFLLMLCTIITPVVLGWTIYKSITGNRQLALERAKAEDAERANELVQKSKLAELEARLGGNFDAPPRNPRPETPPVEAPKTVPKPTPFVVNSGVKSLYQEGQEKFAKGDVRGALESYEMALVIQSNWPDLQEARAQALTASDQAEEAVAEYAKILSREPDRAGSLLGRAKAYLALQKNTEARTDLETLLKMQPENVEAKAELEKLGPAVP